MPRQFRRSGPSRVIAFVALLGLAAAPAGAEEKKPDAEGRVFALLINGGERPTINFLSHLHHLQDMMAALEQRHIPAQRITVFSSDGQNAQADMVQASAGKALPGYWLLQSTRVARLFNPTREIVNTVWEDVKLRPAKFINLRSWFLKEGKKLKAGDTLLIYATDHGSANNGNPDNGYLELWHEQLSVMELEALLAYLPDGVRTAMVMSQCHSGTFAHTMFDIGEAHPSGDVCGFFATTKERLAYGCYPRGRGADEVGHGFHFIDAFVDSPSFEDAHLRVVVDDDAPDVPVRTTDLYLERLIEREAGHRGVELDAVVDELLAEAWKDRGRWERQIRLLDRIGNAYGTFSPRSLAEIKAQAGDVPALASQVKTYSDRWRETYDDLKRDNLRKFLAAHPKWQTKLETKATKGMEPAAAEKLVRGLAPKLLRFTRKRKDVWKRLQQLRRNVSEASDAWQSIERRVAINLRLRTQLVRTAGLVLVDKTGFEDARKAFDALADCEAMVPGTFDPPELVEIKAQPEPLVDFEDQVSQIKLLLPSWLGIQFRPAKKGVRDKRGLATGAVIVQTVFPDSPAAKAGLQPGDIVLGPEGAHFQEPRQIREWTMTSPQDTPLPIQIIRDDEPMEISLSLGPYPLEWPKIPAPPKVGDAAPKLARLESLRGHTPRGEVLELDATPHMLFFWATWCGPCKAAVPELMAWAEQSGVSVIAVTDEDAATVDTFLAGWTQPFIDDIASDELRQSFVAHGVSGTPTFVHVDASGTVKFRQVGYSLRRGLPIDQWQWADRPLPKSKSGAE